MINVKIDAELLANAKFGEQVENVVNEIRNAIKKAIASLQPKQKLKSSAVLQMYNAGTLTKDYFMAEFEKICNRASKQPRAVRDVIGEAIVEAARRTIIEDQRERGMKAAEKANAKAAAEAKNEQGESDELRRSMEARTGAAEGD
ncbi:MAG: hypothetical protein IKU23_02615 [Clostridia bacterium]|nr:hypothetical protein [Clostridia bacterium]